MRQGGSRMTARAAGDEDREDGDFWPADRPELPHRKLLLGGAAVVAAIGVALGVTLLVSGGDEKPARTGNASAALPTVYTPSIPNKDTAKLGQRKVDARLLTEAEVFNQNAKTLTYKEYTFTLAGKDLTGDCGSVTWGARLQADLKKHGCTQIVRGAYLSRNKAHVGQFVAFNMATQDGADQVIRDLDRDVGAGFVLPLKAPGVDKFGKGFSAAYSQSFGHYAILTWVQRNGGAQPASLNEMINVSVAVEKAGDFVWERLELVPDAKPPR